MPCDAHRILRFDPATTHAERLAIGPDRGAYGDGKWSGCVLGANGHIYFVPMNAKRILQLTSRSSGSGRLSDTFVILVSGFVHSFKDYN